MLFTKPKKLTYQEDFVTKKTIVFLLLAISFLSGQSIVQVKLKNGTTVDGEFIGTYMEHVHLLVGENINYFKCDDIQSVTKNHFNSFNYDCSKNTTSADILFPPQINPMTGEWETITPDIFNPKKRKVLTKEKEKKVAKLEKHSSENKKPQKNSIKQPGFNADTVLREELEKTKNNFQKIINTKVRPAISSVIYENGKEKAYQNKTQSRGTALSSSSRADSMSSPKKGLTTYDYEDGTISFSEDEIRRFIKKEVRKELRKALPYEIKKHKEQRQSKLFQNVLFGCVAWFLFMIMLS